MQITGREVKAVYLKNADLFYVELLLRKGDCPEKREFIDVELCPGDCQGTYLSALIKDDIIRIVGSIYPRPHIMYNEEFVKKRNLQREQVEEYVRDYLKNNRYTVKSFMSGRKKRIYVKGEHVGTFFEGCVFRLAEGEFVSFLAKLREKDLEKIARNLDKIKKIAVPVTIQEFGKLTRSQKY